MCFLLIILQLFEFSRQKWSKIPPVQCTIQFRHYLQNSRPIIMDFVTHRYFSKSVLENIIGFNLEIWSWEMTVGKWRLIFFFFILCCCRLSLFISNIFSHIWTRHDWHASCQKCRWGASIRHVMNTWKTHRIFEVWGKIDFTSTKPYFSL